MGERITAYLMDDHTIEFCHSDMGPERLTIQSAFGFMAIVDESRQPVVVSREELAWMINAEARLKAGADDE